MNNDQISISYNGHKTSVTCLANNVYMVQITSRPFYIKKQVEDDAVVKWLEVETDRETNLSKELGQLISKQLQLVH